MNFRMPFRPHRLAPRARLLAYAMFVSIGVALVTARAVYARVGEGALRAGREIEGLGDVLGGTKTVFINGAAMNISTAFADQTPAQVLDRFEAVCRAHPQFMVRALADIPAALLQKAKVHPDEIWRLGVLRKEAGDEGVLVCFADDRASSMQELMSRLRAFGRTKDLAEFGRFHYVYAKRTPNHTTHVRALWTEGELKRDRMFPRSGDAAGFDSSLLPRPPDSKRILSVTSLQVPYGVHAYVSPDTEAYLRSFYRDEMAARGWTLAPGASTAALGYSKDGAVTFVSFGSRDGKTFITTTETSRGDTPTQADIQVER